MKFNLINHKTDPCSEHLSSYTIMLHCPFFHSIVDRRRKLDFLQIKPIFIWLSKQQTNQFCNNIVEYLFHPQIYKTKACKYQNCDLQFQFCPFLHNSQQSKRQKYANNILKDINISIEKIKNGWNFAMTYQQESTKKEVTVGHKKQKKKNICLNLQKSTNNNTIKQNLNKTLQLSDKYFNNQNSEFVNSIPVLNNIHIQKITEEMIQKDKPHNQFIRIDLPLNDNDSKYKTYFKYSKIQFFQDKWNQFKDFKDPLQDNMIKRLTQIVCSFLNCEGGTIYIGVNDNRIIKGTELSQQNRDKFLLKIDKYFRESLYPPSLMSINIQFYRVFMYKRFMPFPEKDYYVIEIKVNKTDNRIYSCNNNIYVRREASSVKLNNVEIRHFTQQKWAIEKKRLQKIEKEYKILMGLQIQNASKKQLMDCRNNLNKRLQIINKRLKNEE